MGGYSPTLRKPQYEGEIKTLPSGSFGQGGGHSPGSGSPSLSGNTALLSGRPTLTGDPGLQRGVQSEGGKHPRPGGPCEPSGTRRLTGRHSPALKSPNQNRHTHSGPRGAPVSVKTQPVREHPFERGPSLLSGSLSVSGDTALVAQRLKNLTHCRRPMFNPWVGKMPGGGHGNPLQSSCLENPMDRGAWQATVQGVAKSQTRLSDSHFHFLSV